MDLGAAFLLYCIYAWSLALLVVVVFGGVMVYAYLHHTIRSLRVYHYHKRNA